MKSAIQEIQWINILPRTKSHTVLGENEFRDSMLLRYQSRPKDTPNKCYGWTSNKPFTLQYALQYKVGSLVTGRHNKVCDSLAHMGAQGFSS